MGVIILGDIFQKSGEIQTLNIINTCLRKVTEEKAFNFPYFLVTEKVMDEQSTESVLKQTNHRCL